MLTDPVLLPVLAGLLTAGAVTFTVAAMRSDPSTPNSFVPVSEAERAHARSGSVEPFAAVSGGDF